MRRSFSLGLSLIGAAAASVGVAASTAATAAASLGDAFASGGLVDRRRGKGQRNRRGKGAARRHGAKLRNNMRTVSKRVRRKHRRAA